MSYFGEHFWVSKTHTYFGGSFWKGGLLWRLGYLAAYQQNLGQVERLQGIDVEVGRVRLDSNLHPSDLMGLVTLGKSQFKPQGD